MIYWIFFALVNLIRLAYQDVKNNMYIDDRINYFMMGVTISLIAYYPSTIWYFLILFVTIIILSFLIAKFKLMGEGDVNTILWLFIGMAIINYWLLVYYLIFFMAILALEAGLFYIIRHWLKAKVHHFPAYPAFLIAFVIVIFTGKMVF